MRCFVLIFIIQVCSYAWDANESATMNNISTNTNTMTNSLNSIKTQLMPPGGDTLTYSQTIWDLIKDNNESINNNTALSQYIYDGYMTWNTNENSKAMEDGLGAYRSFVNGLMIADRITINRSEKSNGPANFDLPSFQTMNDRYQSFISAFSTTNYEQNTWGSSTDSTVENFMNYPDKFSFIAPIAEHLDTDNADFQPETLKNVEGMSKVNILNDSLETNINKLVLNPIDNGDLDGDIWGSAGTFGHNTFTIDLRELGNIWLRMKNRIMPGQPVVANRDNGGSNANINPFRDWVFEIRLIPEQGDYLYNLYTWYHSSQPIPLCIRNCLNAIVYIVLFYMCFGYVKELWVK